MFHDTPEGQTHYQNDGCGEVLHNEIITCAAIWWPKIETKWKIVDNVNGTVVAGKRHGDCFYAAKDAGIISKENHENRGGEKQGFITSHRRFVTRPEAAKIAYLAQQIKEEQHTLYSEDLY